ncbi:hypothetical protein [Dactylosporangium sp. NPDC049140]|uniref:hypothetical protein n=1 Tax=Dactylosporangium sp. NPDC049140 TaxID=3155647 RepID=UPI0033CD3774
MLGLGDTYVEAAGLFVAAAGLGVAAYWAVARRRSARLRPARLRPAGPVTVQVRDSAGVYIGDHGRQQNFFRVDVPAAMWASLVTLVASVLAVGAGWLYLGWFKPSFAPNYRTQFLVDTAETTDRADLGAVTTALSKAVGNSGDHDALALRRFGGECGATNNTTSLTGFGTGDRRPLVTAASGLRAGGKPTLVRGIVEAVEDFSKPLGGKARQVDRIIVVTRHGADACDDDTAYVEREIRERVGAAGLALEFRVIGYQVPDGQHAELEQITTAVKAPPPVYAANAADLERAVDWYSNVEPVLHGAAAIVDTLNATVTNVNTAVDAVVNGRLDVADATLAQAKRAADDTGAQFADLTDRVKTADAREVHDRAVRLREQQQRVVAAASELLATARAGSPLEPPVQRFRLVAADYNSEVNALNQVLAALRAKLTAGP